MDNGLTIGLSYDDILLLPGYSDFGRDDVDTSTKLTKNITLRAPFVSAPMDTVTNSAFATALAIEGGLGILHRNLRIQEQAEEVASVKKAGDLVGAAAGVGEGYKERIEALVSAGVDIICIDTAHGYTDLVIAAIKQTKKAYPNVEIIAGSIATYAGAKALAEAGADALRVGMVRRRSVRRVSFPAWASPNSRPSLKQFGPPASLVFQLSPTAVSIIPAISLKRWQLAPQAS